jgi:hypothetical protein
MENDPLAETERRDAMKTRMTFIQPVLFFVFIMIAACGTGGGDGNGNGGGAGASTGDTSGAGTTVGTITGFGSMTVSGITFKTGQSQQEIEGEVKAGAVDDNFKIGMVVEIEGVVDDNSTTGTANQIRYKDELEGPVDDISRLSLGELGVLKQTVVLDDLTIFENITAGSLQLNNIVEVSGYRDDQGRILATYIEKKPDDFVQNQTEVELKGEITSLGATSFTIGKLTVNFTNNVLDDSITNAGGLSVGMFVEVKGNSFGPNGELIATQVELEDKAIDPTPGSQVELEGVVTRFVSTQDFDIGEQAVRLASGVSGTGIALGVRLKVKGTLTDGVVVADEVIIRPKRNIKIEADLSTVDEAAGTVTVFASATTGTTGIVVNIDKATVLRDKTDDTANPFPPLGNLQVGDRVKIRAFQKDGDVIAVKFERDNAKTRVRLQGLVSSENEADQSLVILGVTVDASKAVEFRDVDDTRFNSAADFFAALSAGAVVKVTGTFEETTGIITANELELEGENENEFEFEFENENEFEFESENEEEFEQESRGRILGRIDGFGSIRVTGKQIDIKGAAITFGGKLGAEADLGVGMQVDVEVRVNDTTNEVRATHVEVETEITGPVDQQDVATNLAEGILLIAGQTVKLDGSTVFANISDITTLTPGQIVEVSGPRDANGAVHATRLELKANNIDDLPEGDDEIELKGTVSELGPSTFKIGDQVVDFTNATLDPAITAAGGLSNGMVVEVKSDQALAADGSLVASSIELEDEGVMEAEGVEVTIEGLVTDFTSVANFDVVGQAVDASGAVFRRGTAADLALGRQVEVEGVMDENNILVAREVTFELAKNVKIEGEVESKDTTSGTVTALGIEVIVNNSTEMEDDRDEVKPFGLSDIAEGDRVEIKAFVDGDGNAVAAKLKREEAQTDGRVRLQGPVASANGNVVTVLGATIDTTEIPDNRFENVNDQQITRAEFLNLAQQEGNLVKFRGTKGADGTIAWERGSIETEHEFENEAENEFEFELEDEVEEEDEV